MLIKERDKWVFKFFCFINLKGGIIPKKAKSKSKHKKVKISEKYEVIGKSLKRKFKRCPKCRNILADMKTRYYCGYCKYTETSQKI